MRGTPSQLPKDFLTRFDCKGSLARGVKFDIKLSLEGLHGRNQEGLAGAFLLFLGLSDQVDPLILTLDH